MCYIVDERGDRENRKRHQVVGVRELRQNLSRYLRRVAAGEQFEVTERSHPVAILAPLPQRRSALESLAGEGRLVRARLDLLKLGLPPERQCEMSISEALGEQREEPGAGDSADPGHR
jgi:prevent-host-death family protein